MTTPSRERRASVVRGRNRREFEKVVADAERRGDWTRPCREGTIDPTYWVSESSAERSIAQDACQDCKHFVRRACAKLGSTETFGVWGGLDRAGRRRKVQA